MRTKTLLLTAALAAAGLTSSMAQTVFSVNAVGFVNVTVPANGFALLANPLNQTTNDLATVLPDAPANTQVFEFNPAAGGFAIYTKRSTGAWTGSGADTARLDPGEGFFVKNGNAAAAATLTFIGEVPQGNLSTPIQAGFNLLGSKVPQTGAVETDLKLPAAANDVVFAFNSATQGYTQHTRRSTGAWTPAEPSVAVANGFWLRAAAAGNWTRTFSVNQ